ncbi:unnamed protein product [Amoebophrya sp. A120]|nr:unnamed protein product [Amoebophrya sp. A120]|eukprot:GSA120T00018927001.1
MWGNGGGQFNAAGMPMTLDQYEQDLKQRLQVEELEDAETLCARFASAQAHARDAVKELRDLCGKHVLEDEAEAFADKYEELQFQLSRLRQANSFMRKQIDDIKTELTTKDPVHELRRRHENDLYEEGLFMQQILHAGVPDPETPVDLIPEDEWPQRQELLDRGLDPNSTLYRLHHMAYEHDQRTILEAQLKGKKDVRNKAAEELSKWKEQGEAKTLEVEKAQASIRKILEQRKTADQGGPAASPGLQPSNEPGSRKSSAVVLQGMEHNTGDVEMLDAGTILEQQQHLPGDHELPPHQTILPAPLEAIRSRFAILPEQGYDPDIDCSVLQSVEEAVIAPRDSAEPTKKERRDVVLIRDNVQVCVSIRGPERKEVSLRFRLQHEEGANSHHQEQATVGLCAYAYQRDNVGKPTPLGGRSRPQQHAGIEAEIEFSSVGEENFKKYDWLGKLLRNEITALAVVQNVREQVASLEL